MMGARLHQDLSKIPHHRIITTKLGPFLKCLMCVTIVRVVGTSCRQIELFKASDPKQLVISTWNM